MPVGQRIRRLGRLTSTMTCLLALAAVLLIVGLILQQRGLQVGANVAQVVSMLFAIPPLLAPLLARLRSAGHAEPQDMRGETLAKGTDRAEAGPLRVTAEVLDTEELAQRADGQLFPIGGHSLQVYVESAGGTVLLRRLRPVVVSRERVNATRIPHPSLGMLEPRPFYLMLDPDPPELRATRGGKEFPFSVAPSDPEVFKIVVGASRGQTAWYLLLDWTLHGNSGTYRIDAAGQPFVTFGREDLKEPRQ